MSYPDQDSNRGQLIPAGDRISLRLLSLGAVTIGNKWSHNQYSDPFWRVYLNENEGATIKTDHQWLPLLPNQIYLIPAWCSFQTRCLQPVGHIFAHFDLPGLPGPMLRRCFNQVIKIDDTCWQWRQQLRHIAESLVHNHSCTPRTSGLCKGIIDGLLGEVFSQLEERSGNSLHQQLLSMTAIQPALELIENELASQLDNESLARACAYSSDHLIRLFQKHLGQSPANYVSERRVAHAAHMLAFSNDSIDSIAAACGFPNRNYFTRVFSKQIGLPPAAYRQMNV